MRLKQQYFLITTVISLLLASACDQRDTDAEQSSPADAVAGNESAPAATDAPAALPRTASPDGARVFFITPMGGETVSNPVTIEFGIEAMNVVRSGDNQPQSGHHHLLIDAELPNLAWPIPADTQHVHFGDASTSTQITLESGDHTLRLLLGDYLHIPHDPPVISEMITITVK